ncbi:hypothetical protein AK812_SmicGene43335, partial [Symbiodinium microadriaticum]
MGTDFYFKAAAGWVGMRGGGDRRGLQPAMGESVRPEWHRPSVLGQEEVCAPAELVGSYTAWAARTSGGSVSALGWHPGFSAVSNELTNVDAIFTNQQAWAARKSDGTVVTWGDSFYGGDSSAVKDQLNDVETISAVMNSFAAKKRDGTVVAWRFFLTGGDASSVADQLTNVDTIVSSFHGHAARKTDGTVVIWGDSNWLDTSAFSNMLTDVVRVIGDSYKYTNFPSSFAAIKADDTAVIFGGCIGFAYSRAGGNGYVLESNVRQIISTEDSNSIAVLKTDDRVVTYSRRESNSIHVVQQDSLQFTNVDAVLTVHYDYAARKHDGTVTIWDPLTNTVKAQLTGVDFIARNRYVLAARKTDGTVETWYAETGYADVGGDLSAVSAQLTNVVGIFNTMSAFAALKADGSVVTWGDSDGGDSSAVADQLTNVNEILAGDLGRVFAAKKNDSSTVFWGGRDKSTTWFLELHILDLYVHEQHQHRYDFKHLNIQHINVQHDHVFQKHYDVQHIKFGNVEFVHYNILHLHIIQHKFLEFHILDLYVHEQHQHRYDFKHLNIQHINVQHDHVFQQHYDVQHIEFVNVQFVHILDVYIHQHDQHQHDKHVNLQHDHVFQQYQNVQHKQDEFDDEYHIDDLLECNEENASSWDPGLKDGLAVILSDILGIDVASEDVDLTVLNETQTGRLSQRRLQEVVELVRATFVAYKAFVLEQDAAGFLDNITTSLQSTATINQVTADLAEQLELAYASFQVDEVFVVQMDVAQASDPPIEVVVRPTVLEEPDNNSAVASVAAIVAVVASCCMIMVVYSYVRSKRPGHGQKEELDARSTMAGVTVESQAAEPAIDSIMAASGESANVTDILNSVQRLEEVLEEVGISFDQPIDNAAEDARNDIGRLDEALGGHLEALKMIGISFEGLEPGSQDGVVEEDMQRNDELCSHPLSFMKWVAAETATAPAADDSGDRALQELRRRAKEADLRDLLRRFEAGVGHEAKSVISVLEMSPTFSDFFAGYESRMERFNVAEELRQLRPAEARRHYDSLMIPPLGGEVASEIARSSDLE